MRLHRLSMTAFGPFAGTEEIDLERLTASGLFLLEGPTGAGKSTVLDAVTFALYGQTASKESSAERLRSHFAPADATPRVELDLTVRGQRLRIVRTPEHARPKKRGDGFTTEKASVRLDRFEGGDWAHVSSHVQEVAQVLDDVVGLSREQFTKVVLLPQGEFATFLRADDDVRRALLTKIFGTGLYDKVTAELENRRREAFRLREQAREQVLTCVASAAEAAGLDAEEAVELLALDDDARRERLDSLAGALAEADSLAVGVVREAHAQLEAAQAAHAQAEQLVAVHDDLAAARAALAAHEATEPEHRARVAELDDARRAVPVGALLASLAVDEAAADDARAALLAVLPDADADALEGRGADAREAAARDADAMAAGLAHAIEVEAALAESEAAVAALVEEIAAAESRVVELRERRDALPLLIKRAEAEVASVRETAGRYGALELQVADLEKRQEAAVALVRARERVATAALDHEQAVLERLGLHERWNDLRQAHLDGIAAQLAHVLVVGEPCLVCGGVEHPSPAVAAPDAVSAEDVAQAESAYQVALAAAEAAQDRLARLRAEQAALEAVAGGDDVASLDSALAAAQADMSTALAASMRVTGLEAEHAGLVAEASGVAGALGQAQAELVAERNRLAVLEASLAGDRLVVATGRDGHPSVSARRDALLGGADRHRAAARAITALATALARRDDCRGRAADAAQTAGFADLDAARAAHRDADVVRRLEEQVAAWTQARAELAAAASHERIDAARDGDAEQARAALDEARSRRDALAEVRSLAEARATTARTRVERFTARAAEVAEAEQRLADVVAGTAAVTRLAGLAKGTEGARRISLTGYVLRRWFEEVVAAANVRLAAMSAGRYELERTDDAERKADRSGLSLKVVDRHTGESRSPKSLSGGETFYTSLALALGLADVVTAEAGGVELDTLFIDEGFGTLDPETLEQVMTVIDDLREGGRAVGIVSHVAELKDRISERLEIRRPADQGPSTTRVVA